MLQLTPPALVQNSGWEFNATANIITNKIFSWSVTMNGAFNRNKLIAYPNIEQSPYATTLIVGKPLNIAYFLRYTGVDAQTGEYTFEDKNHDDQITYNPPDDDTYIVDLTPGFLGGLE